MAALRSRAPPNEQTGPGHQNQRKHSPCGRFGFEEEQHRQRDDGRGQDDREDEGHLASAVGVALSGQAHDEQRNEERGVDRDEKPEGGVQGSILTGNGRTPSPRVNVFLLAEANMPERVRTWETDAN